MIDLPHKVGSVVLLALLSGCAMESGLSTPSPTLPAQWINQQQASHAMVNEPRWWTRFESQELNRLVQRALSANTDLRIAAAQVEQADAQLAQAGASLLPTLGVNASAGRNGRIGEGTTGESYSAQFNASYEVDLWGALRNTEDAARASLLASRFNRDTVRLTVIASVVNTYLQIRYLQDSLALAEDNLRLAEQLLEVVQAKVRYGAVSPQDLAQQKTVVANARASLPDLRQRLRQSRYALAVLLGDSPQRLSIEGGDLTGLDLPEIQAGLPDQVLAQRPDVAQAQASLMAADKRVAAARADYWPSITLTGNSGYSSNDLASLLSGNALYNLALSLPQTLFDGGAREARIDQAKASWEQQRASYLGTLLTALEEVEGALGNVQALAQQQVHRDEAYRQASEAYRIARVRYREGATELTDVLNAQSSFNSARQSRLDLAYSQYQSRVTLFRVLGWGGETPGANDTSMP